MTHGRPGGRRPAAYFLKFATPSVISLCAASMPSQPSTFTHLPFSSALYCSKKCLI
ncbi:hypothetical protein DO65_6249 [Burkholderia pseudomallei]|nr:hypothetical protein DO65_6249 [Burkholderia pseudomallei]